MLDKIKLIATTPLYFIWYCALVVAGYYKTIMSHAHEFDIRGLKAYQRVYNMAVDDCDYSYIMGVASILRRHGVDVYRSLYDHLHRVMNDYVTVMSYAWWFTKLGKIDVDYEWIIRSALTDRRFGFLLHWATQLSLSSQIDVYRSVYNAAMNIKSYIFIIESASTFENNGVAIDWQQLYGFVREASDYEIAFRYRSLLESHGVKVDYQALCDTAITNGDFDFVGKHRDELIKRGAVIDLD